MVWCRGFYVQHPKDDFPNYGKESVGDWEGELEGRYEKGRTGYHTLTHFQCDLCHFRIMNGIDPTNARQEYERLMIAIKRASLHAFWSREPGTVRGDLTILRKVGSIAR